MEDKERERRLREEKGERNKRGGGSSEERNKEGSRGEMVCI